MKKAKNWQCKICGEKQSVMQEFGRGSGKDCRQHIQKLNIKMRDKETAIAQQIQNEIDLAEHIPEEDVFQIPEESINIPPTAKGTESKWARYTEDVEEIHDDDEDCDLFMSNTVNNDLIHTNKNKKTTTTIQTKTKKIEKPIANSNLADKQFEIFCNSLTKMQHEPVEKSIDYSMNTENILKKQFNDIPKTIKRIEKFPTLLEPQAKKSKWNNYIPEQEDE